MPSNAYRYVGFALLLLGVTRLYVCGVEALSVAILELVFKPMKREEKFAKALIDPAMVFSSPNAVVDDVDLGDKQKIQILQRWEYDALEEQVADEEGFPAPETRALLDDVVAALHRLGTGPDIEHSPPTKQHGV